MAEMTLAERVKAEITKAIANFLISEKHAPESITIVVTYPESRAKLDISTETIKREFAKK